MSGEQADRSARVVQEVDAGRDANVAGRDLKIINNSYAPVTTISIGTQVFSVSAVPLTAAAKDPRSVFTAVGVEAFTGREWLLDEIDRFMALNLCGYVFVEAEAGLGKTAFAAWLVKTRGYLSHFSRYSGGASVQVALANLAAQLITNFGLDDQAPGGMLPQWAQTPDGFESLLAVAAERARELGHSVVLVVDGLDEADTPGQGLPFGLPSLLPDGVYVVGTHRTGRSPRRPDAPAATVRIGKEDQRNRADIGAYLAKAAGEDVLAAQLAEAGMESAEFTALLADRCDGVWVYLRYVLNELRFGLRRPEEISGLPAGLRNYYADQIRHWQQDSAWHTGLLPLLATLAVVGEALPAAALARLAGNIDQAAIQRWCDLTIRPLLTTTRIPASGTRIRYEIYHASFRELLNAGFVDESSWAGDQHSYELLALADDLRQAAISAHNRICDTYLTCFGGLVAGLPVLAEDPGTVDMDDGYPLRYLAHHLCQSGRAAELHTLLTVEHSASGNHAVNTWFAAHDHADSVINYLDDLARARSDSAATTDQDLIRHQPSATLGMEIRYALMAATVTSLTANISTDLLGQLIRAGVWSPRKGLDHARRVVDPSKRLDALLAVSSQLNADEQPLAMALALAAATAITDHFPRRGAMARLAPHLPPELLAQALAAAIADKFFPGEMVAELAPHLPPELLAEALDAAIAITDDSTRAHALARLAPHLPAALLAQALAATVITDDPARAYALTALAARLPSGLLPQALAAATAITDDSARAAALAGLVPHLAADERPAVIDKALAAATSTTGCEDFARAQALARLAPYLPAQLLVKALAAAISIADASDRARALAGLAPHLQPELLAYALATATVIEEYARDGALAGLAPHLPPNLLPLALAAAATITFDHTRARALAGLAPHLPPDLLAQALVADDSAHVEALAGLAPYLPPELLTYALGAATVIAYPHRRAQALAELAPHLPPDLLAEALAAATAITDDDSRAQALAGLAPSMPPDLLAKALAGATAITHDSARAQALAGLAPHLVPDKRLTVITQALAAAIAIGDDSARAQALVGLAPYLAPDKRLTVITQALAAATTAEDASRAEALAWLAPHLPPDLLAQALAAAITTTDEYARGEALAVLAPHLHLKPLAQALATASSITDGLARARTLAWLAPRLPPELLAQALAAATAIPDGWPRARALAWLAPRLPPELLAQALAAATAIPNEDARNRVLAGLAPHLAADERRSVIAQVLATATTAGAAANDHARGEVLAVLAPHLPPDLLAQALAAAITITDEYPRAEALTGLAPHLPPDLLAQALAAVTTTTYEEDRARELAVLAPYLPPELLAEALAAAIAITDGSYRARALAGLAPHLPPALRTQALASVTNIHAVARAQALAGLASYLSPDLLAQAVAAAPAAVNDSARARALTALAPHLPPDLLAQALAVAPRTSLETLTAILERSRSVLPRDGDTAYLDLLRDSLNGTDRRICFGVITATAPVIAKIGGVRAIEGCVNAVFDVHRWWP